MNGCARRCSSSSRRVLTSRLTRSSPRPTPASTICARLMAPNSNGRWKTKKRRQPCRRRRTFGPTFRATPFPRVRPAGFTPSTPWKLCRLATFPATSLLSNNPRPRAVSSAPLPHAGGGTKFVIAITIIVPIQASIFHERLLKSCGSPGTGRIRRTGRKLHYRAAGCSSGRVLFRFEHRDDEGVRLQVFRGDAFDLVERDGFVFGVFGIGVGVTEAIEFIERGGGGEMAEVLARDFLLADQLGPGAFELLDGQTFGAQ